MRLCKVVDSAAVKAAGHGDSHGSTLQVCRGETDQD